MEDPDTGNQICTVTGAEALGRATLGVVAHKVLEDLSRAVDEAWESYPEIGYDDWLEVQRMVLTLAESPYSAKQYATAYAFLEGRADK